MKVTSARRFRPGTLVRVKSAGEIAATLDAQGTLSGLSFMPEMLQFCGREFSVAARIDKTCVEGCGVRRFGSNDVVTLAGVRCDGRSHGGCDVACAIFWKEAWLVGSPQIPSLAAAEDPAKQTDHSTACTSVETFSCQATELSRATRPVSDTGILWLAFKDLLAGRIRPKGLVKNLGPELLRAVAKRRPLLWLKKLKALMFPRKAITVPTGGKTPLVVLGLQPGDWVRVKTIPEIQATLDSQGKNRGLAFTRPLFPYCGGTYRVRARLEKVVLETSGKMIRVPNTVILENVLCHGSGRWGVCPREQYLWWREAWLEKVDAPFAAQVTPAQESSDGASSQG